MKINSKFEKYIISNNDKVKISSIDIKKGDIFLALQGKKFHGNYFINSAIEKGAKYCVTDQIFHIKNSKIIYVENIFEYLLSLALHKRKLYKGKVIGITGSAGKTTLKETLAFFLKKDNIISYSKKSFNNKLGVLVSLLNLNLKSKYSIFEIGTNNFGEIAYLSNIVKPEEVFITNIQSAHLQNFKTKNNIAYEKSDIFVSKFNDARKKLYINLNNKTENIILKVAKKERNLKIVQIGEQSNKYFIKKISTKKNKHQVIFSINNKLVKFETKSIIDFRLSNFLFCLAFFNENKLNLKTLINRQKYLKPVEGRGSIHSIFINRKNIKVIDESYNANPDTMNQCFGYFNEININNRKKILILGNMNELGKRAEKLHLNLLKNLDKFKFKFIILSGEFHRTSIKKIIKPNNNFIYFEDKEQIMKFLTINVHNDDIILIKCSNSTEINKFANQLLKKG